MKRILIVDDEQFLLQGLSNALRSPSTEIAAVETGASALAEIAASHYDICFLDIYLPDTGGIEVMKRIRKISPHTKVIMMTAGIVSSSMQRCIEKNAYMFLTKPFELLQIKMLVNNVLEQAGHTAALACPQ